MKTATKPTTEGQMMDAAEHEVIRKSKTDRLRAQLKRIDERIGMLMSHRVDIEEELVESLRSDTRAKAEAK